MKRVVALPGESVTIKGGGVFVNGEELAEPYLASDCKTVGIGAVDQYVEIGAQHYFVMGDNRGQSEDSRYYGPVAMGQIVGLLTR